MEKLSFLWKSRSITSLRRNRAELDFDKAPLDLQPEFVLAWHLTLKDATFIKWDKKVIQLSFGILAASLSLLLMYSQFSPSSISLTCRTSLTENHLFRARGDCESSFAGCCDFLYIDEFISTKVELYLASFWRLQSYFMGLCNQKSLPESVWLL